MATNKRVFTLRLSDEVFDKIDNNSSESIARSGRQEKRTAEYKKEAS